MCVKYSLYFLCPRFLKLNLLSCSNYIRYSWFCTVPERRTRGIRASDLQAPSPNCLVVHPLDLPKSTKISKIQNPQDPKSQNPKSQIPRIQNPKSPNFGFWGFWILDRYVANLYVRPPTPQILDFGGRFWGFWFWILGISDLGFWILDFGDFGFWILGILDFGTEIQNPKSPIQNPNFFGRFWGFWIFGPLCSKSLCGPKFRGFWILGILDFGFGGFWIWGFRILDFGSWGFWILGILDFEFWGFWILGTLGILDFGDFGFWSLGILDFGFCDKFWILHKKKKTVHADPGRRILFREYI